MRTLRLATLGVVLATGCLLAPAAPAPATTTPIEVVAAPAQAKRRTHPAKDGRGVTTELYHVSLSKRSYIDDALEPDRVDLLSNRALTLDIWLNILAADDSQIRISSTTIEDKPQLQPYDLRVHRETREGLHAEGGSVDQRALVEGLFGLLQTLIPERHSTQQLALGAVWTEEFTQTVRYKGTQLAVHYKAGFRKLPMKERAGDSEAELEVRGTLKTDPVSVQGRTLVGSGKLSGTTWLGPWEESVGAVRVQLVLVDRETGARAGHIEEVIGYSSIRADRGSEDGALARARFVAEHPGDCGGEPFELEPGTVRLWIGPGNDSLANRAAFHWEVDARVGDRVVRTLLARRQDLRACSATVEPSGLTIELARRPFEMRAPFNLTQREIACLGRVVSESLEHVELVNARRIQLVVSSSEPETIASDVHPKEANPRPLPRDQIREMIGSHIDDVRACYRLALEGWPNFAGRTTVEFGIAGDGSVVFAFPAGDEVGSAGLSCCIAGAVKRWHFPAPAEGRLVMVRYPFVLQ